MMEELVVARKEGFICGPFETKESFLLRKSFLLTFEHSHKNLMEKERLDCIERSFEELDVHSKWILIRKNKKIPFWELGRTWEFSVGEMRGSFIEHQTVKNDRFENFLKHEMVHLIRHSFNEPVFEETLAFALDKSFFRRFWGPLFRTSFEVQSMLIFLLVGSTFSLFGWWIGFFLGSYLLVLAFLVIRLLINQKKFKKALNKLQILFSISEPLQVALHLTDKEIIFFSKSSIDQSLLYISQQHSLRWKQIKACFSFK